MSGVRCYEDRKESKIAEWRARTRLPRSGTRTMWRVESADNVLSAVKIARYCLTGNSLCKMKIDGVRISG